MNAFERPYDIAMSEELRAAVRDRRRFPDGRKLDIKIEVRGKSEVFRYPWDEMAIGDFFFVPLRDQRPGHLKIRFRQAAARRDWELTIVQWKLGTELGLRVGLSLLDLSEIKKKAQQFHGLRNVRFSDGQWSSTRKARYRRSKVQSNGGTPKLEVISTPVVTEPEQPDLPIDASLSPNYDRGQIIRDRLAALGIPQ